MLAFYSIFPHICRFVHGLAENSAKRMIRSSAIFITGAVMITVVAFASTGFGNGGRNALTAFAQAPRREMPQKEGDVEEEESVTEAKRQVQFTEIKRQGQRLAGSLLEKDIQLKQEMMQDSKERICQVNRQIVTDAKIKALEAKEEARLKAREEEKRKEEEKRAADAKAVSDDDYQVLLKIVQAEAGVCDEKGKILVADVILNRMKGKGFPGTVRAVVYEPSQFSPVSDGSINSVMVTQQTKECVDRALSGEDYSNGALYFMNRRGSQSGNVRWFDSHLTYLFSHQSHEFFK